MSFDSPFVSFVLPPSVPVFEEGDIISIEVQLSAAAANVVDVSFEDAFRNIRVGDLSILDTSLSFAPGETSQFLRIRVEDDDVFEADEIMHIQISEAVGATVDMSPREGVGDNNEFVFYVAGNDTPDGPIVSFDRDGSVPDVVEGDVLTLTLLLSEASDVPVTVRLAESWSQYAEDATLLMPTVVFQPGQTSTTVEVRIEDDQLFEPSHLLRFEIVEVENASIDVRETGRVGTFAEFIVDVAESDAPTEPLVSMDAPFPFAEYNEGDVVSFTVRLSEIIELDVVVTVGLGDASIRSEDLELTETQLVIPAGSLSATGNVDVLNDSLFETEELMSVVILSAENATVDVSDATVGEANEFFFYVTANDERIMGNEDSNDLIGDTDENAIFGNEGDDTLNGAEGDDFLTGGDGRDVFVFEPQTGHDTVTDFRIGEDTIDLSAFSAQGHVPVVISGLHVISAHGGRLGFGDTPIVVSMAQDEDDVRIEILEPPFQHGKDSKGVSITLMDVQLSQIGLEEFLF
ncbi:calcium-binding protein [Shimia ponticola]|uniref:calcium-binding protein n=1 Tax=Shimia ponticola TaxID=2582893 RepID=UPI0011BD6828|nr:calcium-binding protein [Shimia ponticola]